MEILIVLHKWILAAHIIAVMFWMGGLYYLPRLFVYHAEAIENGKSFRVFETMEAKLLRLIINPSMIAAWAFGGLLLATPGFLETSGYWLWVKLSAVFILSGLHGFLSAQRREFLNGSAPHTSHYYRVINEIPPILTIVIVIMVVVRPF